MTLLCICADDVAPQPWRNGGGTTRELLCWPDAKAWSARVSVADVASDGPFSPYPGIARWFAVIEGAGVLLSFGRVPHWVELDEEPFRFDGAAAPACQLIDGPTRDLNLMLRDGQGLMCDVVAGLAWRSRFKLRGLYTTGAGRWLSDGSEQRLEANTLLWSDSHASAVWCFEPDDPLSRAWWMGFTPAANS
jgi:environmental stress-induced protein Ves